MRLLIILGGIVLLLVLGIVLLYWFVLKPDSTAETLLSTNFRGMPIRIQRNFYKAKIDSNSESITLYLGEKKAAETGTVWEGWGNPDARPLPVHKEDMARIMAIRTFLPDSLYDDQKYRNLWIRPKQFSWEQFTTLADYVRLRQGSVGPPFGTIAKNFPYFISHLVYGDPDPMQSRVYIRDGANEESGSVQVRMDGEVEYWQWPYVTSIGKVEKGGDFLLFNWDRNCAWAGPDTTRLTPPDLVHFRNKQGKALSEYYQIRKL